MPQRPLFSPPDAAPHLVGVGCMDCQHLIDLVEGICLAFPDRIPADIMEDRIRHDRPYPGDHGLQFQTASKSQRLQL